MDNALHGVQTKGEDETYNTYNTYNADNTDNSDNDNNTYKTYNPPWLRRSAPPE